MKKAILIFAALFFVASASAQNNITLNLGISCTGNSAVQSYSIQAGQIFTVSPWALPAGFEAVQPLYDALVGSTFEVPANAIHEDVEIYWMLQGIDCGQGHYLTVNGLTPIFRANFLVLVNGNPVAPFTFDNPVTLTIPNSSMVQLMTLMGVPSGTSISFSYIQVNGTDTVFVNDGITTTPPTATNPNWLISINHFSIITGGDNTVLTSVDDKRSDILPQKFALNQNYPNPFNPSTKIAFSLPERTDIELNVYNVLGVKIATLSKGTKEAGNYEATFDANNLPSGLYLYELKAGKYSQSRKMLLVK